VIDIRVGNARSAPSSLVSLIYMFYFSILEFDLGFTDETWELLPQLLVNSSKVARQAPIEGRGGVKGVGRKCTILL
jgi:hypothetical protein